MSSLRHRDTEFERGATWVINGILQDASGQPLGLAGASLQWTLLDEAGAATITLPGAAGSIALTDIPGGLCQITVSAATTAILAKGRYEDRLRVTIGAVVSPLWHGNIAVAD